MELQVSARSDVSAMNGGAGAPVTAGSASVQTLSGVGPAFAAALARLGVEHVQDLWFHLPLRYEDRTHATPVAALIAGQTALVEVKVEACETGFRYRPQLRVIAVDDAGAMLELRFFHFRGQQARTFQPGTRLRCFGQVRVGHHGLEMIHPQYRRVNRDTPFAERLTPVYPATEGLGQKRLGAVISQALLQLPAEPILELIPEPVRAPLGLGWLRDALLFVHHPSPGSSAALLDGGRHPAMTRLAFEELLAQHLGLKLLRASIRRQRAPCLASDPALAERLLAALPFALTGAQRRVAAEINADLADEQPMLRLVQGDVGSGKTVVAALAAVTAVASGYQVALMAPTELLAEQHYASFRQWMAPLGIDVAWLAGSVHARARTDVMARIASGVPIVVGTHALMQEGVEFARLGLVIIDEQHRFGVHQRLALRDKGRSDDLVPHQLVLTATPIPRTLAMSAYADLDVSSIDELPPGRTPVTTVAISVQRRAEVIDRIRVACAEGRQVYWVCTLIEESDQLDAQAAELAYTELTQALPELHIGLVHGRMKPALKQAAMSAFKAGQTQVLVATTVIEVGVDVPNASVMVIENAERLGLAQLHQLRGRVGRGAAASSCVLFYQPPLSALARQRLAVMRETTDGFRIAEKDLELRGPGEVLGTRQTGQLAFRVADLARDAHLLPAVQDTGAQMLAHYPEQARQLVRRWVGAASRYADA